MVAALNDLTELEQLAAQLTEQYNALVKAGMPATAAAVMLGTWMGTVGSHNAAGGDGR